MKKLMRTFRFFLAAALLGGVAGVFLFAPAIASATHIAGIPDLLPACVRADATKGGGCTVCDLFALVQNALKFIWFGLVAPLATIFFIYGGFLMVSSSFSGAANTYQKGKQVLTKTLTGIIIVFLAWLMVDTLIKVLAGQALGEGKAAAISGYGPWNQV